MGLQLEFIRLSSFEQENQTQQYVCLLLLKLWEVWEKEF